MREHTKNLILAGVFAALAAVAGFVKIPLGVMSMTLQTMLAALAGMVLGPKWGAASMAVYLCLGLLGLPIFTLGGGPGYVFQPSFGFLLGFVLTAAVSGTLAGPRPGPLRAAAAAVVGILAGYVIGVPYMGVILNVYLGKEMSVWAVVQAGLLLYLPGEAVKVLCTALIAPPICKVVRR